MLTNFPLKIKDCKLFVEDFIRFKDNYRKIIIEELVTSEGVNFVNPALSNALPKTVNTAIEQCLMNDEQVIIQDKNVLMIFPCENGQIAVSASGVDSMILKRATKDWLETIYTQIISRMVKIKEQFVDVETGFLNLYSLNQRIKQHDLEKTLYLIEVPQARIGSRYIYSHLQAVTNALSTYVNNPQYLYYLGNAVFCLCLPGIKNNLEYAETLVAFLKREGFKKVHIGIGDISEDNVVHKENDHDLLDKAWTALQEATRRGPYSFCSYSTLLNPQSHPLAFPDTPLKRKIARACQNIEKFSVVLFKDDNAQHSHFTEIVRRHTEKYIVFDWMGDAIVLLPECDEQSAREFATNLVHLFQKKDKSVSAGIACFPFQRFKKTEILMLARKALLHTAFYGNGTVTSFAALSCNVSGDIYYGEGDFNKAVKEYRQGLECEPDDINLLNSLGVTYAMMGRKENITCFEKVLQQEPENFMALYNLGQSYLGCDNLLEAAECFEKSLIALQNEEDQSVTVKSDLQLQLGILCSRLGHSERAIELLEPFTDDLEFSCKHNILFYLGQSSFDQGKRKEAIRWLQKSAAAQCFEDQTLSLLGYLYYLEGQGNDVALSLCRKSVALNPVDQILQLRLAEVLVASNECDEALEIAHKSIRKKKYNKQARQIVDQVRKINKKSTV